MSIETRLVQMGLYLPAPAKVPADVVLDFAWARRHGNRVSLSGHAAQAPDGTVIGPFGRVGTEVTAEEATQAARIATLSLLASLQRLVGDLDRVEAWLRLDGFALVPPGFDRTTNIINGASRLLVELFDPEIGSHARTAMGVAATPLNAVVVLAAEVIVRD